MSPSRGVYKVHDRPAYERDAEDAVGVSVRQVDVRCDALSGRVQVEDGLAGERLREHGMVYVGRKAIA